jgi:hypothetical protein
MILQVINDTMETVVNEVVNTSIAIHELTGGNQIINGIDNSLTGSIITILIAAVVRFFERKQLKKKLSKND